MFHVKRERPGPIGLKHRQVPCLLFDMFAAVRDAKGGSNPQSYPQLYPPVYPPDIHAIGVGCDTYGVPLDKAGQAHERCRSDPDRETTSEALSPGTQSLVDIERKAIAASRQLQNGPRQGGQRTTPGAGRRVASVRLTGRC